LNISDIKTIKEHIAD